MQTGLDGSISPVSPEEAEEAAQRRLRSDGVDDVVWGVILVTFGLVFVGPLRSLGAFTAFVTTGAILFGRFLRKRISDPRLGYVKRLDEPPLPVMKPIALKDAAWGVGALVVIVLLINVDYTWFWRHIDLSWLLRVRRFAAVALGLLTVAGFCLGDRRPTSRDYTLAGLSLAAGVFGSWYWSAMLPGLGAVLATMGMVPLLDGALALWRIRRLPVVALD